MYNSYFGFSDSPFENNLDQRFLFLSENHKEVLAALHYFVREKKGFALVCGDVGTGKTMLINCFVDRLPKSFQPMMISNPDVEYLEILHHLARALKIATKEKEILELLDEVRLGLINAKEQGKRFVLIIDEAHLLSDRSLEHIRLLSNIETADQKLLQILLVGQYELSHRLDRTEMRQLRQRININRFLAPMDASETIQYVDQRLKVVGSDFDSCFQSDCRKLIFQMTDGVPRRINQLCDNALLICRAQKSRKVNRKILTRADEALNSDLIFTPGSSSARKLPHLRQWLKPAVLVGQFGLLLVIAGVLANAGLMGKTAQEAIRMVFPATEIVPGEIRGPAPDTRAGETAAVAVSREESKTAKEPLEAESQRPVALHSDSRTKGSEKRPAEHAQDYAKLDQSLKEGPAAPVPAPAFGLPTQPEPSDSQLQTEVGEGLEQPEEGAAAIENDGPLIQKGDTEQAFVPSAPEPAAVRPLVSNSPRETVVREGDTLLRIASRWYPENPDSGLRMILAANPQVTNRDRIYPGQRLTLPGLEAPNSEIQLRDKKYYVSYGRYGTLEALNEAMAWLIRNKVKYLVVNTVSSDGVSDQEIVLGGYETVADLKKALELVKANAE